MLHTGLQKTSEREGARGLPLHVLFLAGGNNLAAQTAAHWTKLLANGRLEVDAVGPGGMNPTVVSDCASAGLVVVIHTPSHPGPVVAHNCGGRIDWNLEVDVAEVSTELRSLLLHHVMCLLADLGISRAQCKSNLMYPPVAPNLPNRPNGRVHLLAA